VKVRQCARSAFTLVELTVGAAVASIVFAALAIGAVSLQKTFVAVDTYGGAQGDQMRALDYMTRDIRRAQTVTVVSSPPSVTLTAQTYFNPATGTLNTPTVAGGVVSYGGSSTITYALSGKSLTRTEGGSTLVVGTNVTSRRSIQAMRPGRP
jgi:type II secretory pathway pseudopilin PulG